MLTRYLSIIFLVLLSLTVVVFANEENKDSEKKEKIKSAKPTVSKRAQVKTLEEFIPSEEVSADKPVAFPNDI